MTIEEWRRVLWSDESPFVLIYNGRKLVWRLGNERYSITCCTGTVKHDIKIMVWGCFAAHGVGNLYLVEGIMEQVQYRTILENQLLPSAERLFPGEAWYFQQDNDPKHTANATKQYMIDNQIPILPWPSQSPDLNPIENLWSILDYKLRNRRPQNQQQLFEALTEGWNSLDRELLTNLADSMPRRIQAVLEKRDYPTKY